MAMLTSMRHISAGLPFRATSRVHPKCETIAPYRPDFIIGDTVLLVLTITAIVPLLFRINRFRTTFGLSKEYVVCNFMYITAQSAMMVLWWTNFQFPRTIDCISSGELRGWDAYAALSRGLGVFGSWLGAALLLFVCSKYPRTTQLLRYEPLPYPESSPLPNISTGPSEAHCVEHRRLAALDTEHTPLLQTTRTPNAQSLSSTGQSASSKHSQLDGISPWFRTLALAWTVLCIATAIFVGIVDNEAAVAIRIGLIDLVVGYPAPLILTIGCVLQFRTFSARTVDERCSVLSPRTIFLQAVASLWLGIRLIEEFGSRPYDAIIEIWLYLWEHNPHWWRTLGSVIGAQYYHLTPYLGNVWYSFCLVMLILRYLWVKGKSEGHQGVQFLVKYEQAEGTETTAHQEDGQNDTIC